ncbi:sensor histidine kinase [Streptomyces sp. NPDC048111]|uniref:sensor histidine kinase n=1 Tax=Streptomyces sp. NPDC048111 TaxID=3365500 RepID=UPI003714CFC6
MQQQETRRRRHQWTGRGRHQWVARELHDRVGNELAVAQRQLELVELHLTRDPALAAERISGGLRALAEAMRVTRELAGHLNDGRAPLGPRTGAAGGLPPLARTELAGELRAFAKGVLPSGTRVVVQVTGEPVRLGAEHRGQLFLILCEALRNAAAHAKAEHVVVYADITDTTASAVVEDNGRGFDMNGAPPAGRGIGLGSMRERARSLGGTLTVASVPGRGTRVTAWLPLEPRP